jgi:2-polyprenyl-3-methyl-5-hydroxy-6-metoxy-1,4-benzoquinol methylase
MTEEKEYIESKQTWQDKRLGMINWNFFKDKTVLDIGGNKGILTMRAKQAGAKKVIWVDKEAHLRDRVRKESEELGLDIDFWLTNIESSEFKEFCPRFDIVFFCAMLCHMKDQEGMLRWVDSHTNEILFFGTNLRQPKDAVIEKVKKYTSFKAYLYVGDCEMKPDDYHLFMCKRNNHSIQNFSNFNLNKIKFLPINKLLNTNEIESTKKVYPGVYERSVILSENIKENGIKEPIEVEYKGNDTYRLIEGGHRCLALKLLGYEWAPVIVRGDKDDTK